jgi:uncharacterized protein involved in response to NO
MIEGFEQCFIAGFLLTALPGLTHAERTRPAEAAAALIPLVAVGVFAFDGFATGAHAAYVLSIAAVAFAAARRIPRATQPPPVEFLFVALGLLFGMAGGILLLLQSRGMVGALPHHFTDRLLSLGLVLSLVLGLGGLLVPTFSEMKNPLRIPFIAGAHRRGPRIGLYLVLVVALAGAFALEWAGRNRMGAMTRAVAGSAMLLLVWKLLQLPGRRSLSAFAMWSSGWLLFAGLWLMALVPDRPMLGLHVVFVGGFGLLTLAIGTRVVVAHGRHGLVAEPVVFSPLVAAGVVLALLSRVAAEIVPARGPALLGLAGAFWCFAWLLWLKEGVPRVLRVQRPAS